MTIMLQTEHYDFSSYIPRNFKKSLAYARPSEQTDVLDGIIAWSFGTCRRLAKDKRELLVSDFGG